MKKTNAEVNICKLKMVKEDSLPYLQKEIMCASDAAEIFKSFRDQDTEEYFNILCLNAKGLPVGIHEVSHGELSLTPVHPREVFKRALLNNASSIVLNHNHPSGNHAPSKEDKELTKRLRAAGKIIGVTVLDHIITSSNGYFSFAGNNMLDE